MWSLIESQADIKQIIPGRVITQCPDDPVDRYEITVIGDCYVRAVHNNGKTALKIFLQEYLIVGRWWIFGIP